MHLLQAKWEHALNGPTSVVPHFQLQFQKRGMSLSGQNTLLKPSLVVHGLFMSCIQEAKCNFVHAMSAKFSSTSYHIFAK